MNPVVVQLVRYDVSSAGNERLGAVKSQTARARDLLDQGVDVKRDPISRHCHSLARVAAAVQSKRPCIIFNLRVGNRRHTGLPHNPH